MRAVRDEVRAGCIAGSTAVYVSAGGLRGVMTRIELANAIFDYLEIFYNRQQRHSSLGMRTPIEYENLQLDGLTVASDQTTRLHQTRGT